MNICEKLVRQGQMNLVESLLSELAERLPHLPRVRHLIKQLSGA